MLGRNLCRPGLRLQVDGALGGDQGQALACCFAAGLNGPSQDADGLARVDAHLAAHGHVGVLPTGDLGGVLAAQVQVLPCRQADAGFADEGNVGVGAVGHFVGTHLGELVCGVSHGVGQAAGADHAAQAFGQGGSGGGLVVERALPGLQAAGVGGQAHSLVGGGRLVECLAQLLGLFGQGHAGGVVARRLRGLAQAVVQTEGAEHHAACGAQGAPAVGAQLQPQAAQAATVVVGLVQQVAHLQPSLTVGAVQVGAQLTGSVVQHELVVAVAAKLFALDAAERGGVGLAFAAFVGGAGGRTVPGGAVATAAAVDQVHLAAGAVVGRFSQGGGVRCACGAARCGSDARFTPAVVQAGDDQGAVDVFTLDH